MGSHNRDLLKELSIDRHSHDDRSKFRLHWHWIAVLAFTACIILSWLFWRHKNEQIQFVSTVTALRIPPVSELNPILQATGYVTANREATVSAQIVGTLTQVLIQEGDHVRKGQVLARLEDTAQTAYLNAARASAQAALAQTLETKASLSQAQRDMSRQIKLARLGLVSKQQSEQAKTKVQSLLAQLNAQRKMAQAAEAQIGVAKVNYNYTVIRAPFTGVVTQKTAQVGEIIAPSAAGGGFTRTGVCTIVDMNSLEVDVDVNETSIGRIKPDMPAQAVLDAYPDWTIPANVIAIVPNADRGKSTVKVRVHLDLRDPRIIPNMGVRISFLDQPAKEPYGNTPHGVYIPSSAITSRNHHEIVFTLDNGHAHAHFVEPTNVEYGGLRLIPSGIDADSTVINMPPSTLRNDDAVRQKSNRP